MSGKKAGRPPLKDESQRRDKKVMLLLPLKSMKI